jgi:hypothetical protein
MSVVLRGAKKLQVITAFRGILRGGNVGTGLVHFSGVCEVLLLMCFCVSLLPGSRPRPLISLCSKSKSKSGLLHDWRLSASQFISASSLLRFTTSFFQLNPDIILLMYHPLWREDGVVSYEYPWPIANFMYRTYRMLLKLSLLHYTQVLCQSRICRANHVYLTYGMIQGQPSHLNGR